MSTKAKTRPRKMPDDWYDSWTVAELRDHRRASMHQAQVQGQLGSQDGDRNLLMVRLCAVRARTYQAEIAKRRGARP